MAAGTLETPAGFPISPAAGRKARRDQ